MKFPRLMLALSCISVRVFAVEMPTPVVPVVTDDAMLSAIAEVESGNNPAKRGRLGERTRLQILPATWRQFSHQPHSAVNRAETDRVAHAYLKFIRGRLRARGLPETAFFIAAAWNAGPNWRRLPRSTVSYAERVANLVEVSSPTATRDRYAGSPEPARIVPDLGAAPDSITTPLRAVPVIHVAAN